MIGPGWSEILCLLLSRGNTWQAEGVQKKQRKLFVGIIIHHRKWGELGDSHFSSTRNFPAQRQKESAQVHMSLSPWRAMRLPRFSPGPNWLCETSLRAHHLSALYFISPIFQMGIIVLALPTSQDCWKGQMRKCMWKLFEKLKVLPNCKGINSSRRRGRSGLFAGNGVLARRVNSEQRSEGDYRCTLPFIPIGKSLPAGDTAQSQKESAQVQMSIHEKPTQALSMEGLPRRIYQYPNSKMYSHRKGNNRERGIFPFWNLYWDFWGTIFKTFSFSFSFLY